MKPICLVLALASTLASADTPSQTELQAIERAHSASTNVISKYQKALRQALGQKGAAKALKDCRIDPVDAEAAFKVGRTSHRLRNANNAPAEWVKPYLEKFAKAKVSDIPQHVLVKRDQGYGYLEPIFVEPICLKCHGQKLPDDLTKAIHAEYPDDQATGFEVGDFRGLLWLEMQPVKNTVPSRTTDYEPLTILTKNCAGCHQKADHPGALFLNRERLTEKDTIQLVITMLETSQMPPQHKKFRNSSEGKKLLRWLKNQLAAAVN